MYVCKYVHVRTYMFVYVLYTGRPTRKLYVGSVNIMGHCSCQRSPRDWAKYIYTCIYIYVARLNLTLFTDELYLDTSVMCLTCSTLQYICLVSVYTYMIVHTHIHVCMSIQ